MNRRSSLPEVVAVGLYRILLMTLPDKSADNFARDMARAFRDACSRARRTGGAFGLARTTLFGVFDLMSRIPREWIDHLRPVARRPVRPKGKGRILDSLAQDIRYAFRSLAKSLGFSAMVIVTLALGVGANTAIYSVVNGVLLRPLPYTDPERLVLLGEENPGFDMPLGWTSVSNYMDWREQATTFEHLAMFRGRSRALTGSDQPLYVYSAMVTANFFGTFGVSPALGRGFLEEESDQGAEPVVVLSHNLWERHYEADSAIVGQAILLDGTARTIVGVMPPGFDAPARWIRAGISMDLWIPFPLFAPASAGRDNRSYNVVGRLTAGVTMAEAQSDMDVISAQLRDAYPAENANWSIGIAGWQDTIVGNLRSALMFMWAAVTLVLLIACANVANLKLNRMLSRRGEMAVRAALGAGRGRLIRQILTESVVLAILGGTLGLALAVGGVELILALNPGNIPMADRIGIDAKVLTVTLVTTLVTGLLFGALPAIYASRPDLANEIKQSAGRSSDAGRHRTRSLVAATQLVLAFTLLIGAGLVAKSFLRLMSVSPGLNPSQVFTATVALSRSRVPTIEERAAFVTAALDRLRTLPGIESVAMINSLPFTGSDATMPVSIEGAPVATPGEQPGAAFRGISPGYFRTMEIPLLRGRDFDNRDLANPQTVLINETMARRHWPDEDPIGKRFSIMWQETMLTVIGLVRDVKHYGLDAQARPEVYQPYSTEYLISKTFVLRTAGDPTVLGPTVERAILSVDPDQPIRDMVTMEELVGRTMADPRFNTVMIGLASLVAVILAMVGLFGTVSYAVTARTREIGVRMALGATATGVVVDVLRRGIALAAAGIAGGVVVSVLSARAVESLLFGVAAYDIVTYAAVSVGFFAVTLVATYLPARRASRVDPMMALRME